MSGRPSARRGRHAVADLALPTAHVTPLGPHGYASQMSHVSVGMASLLVAAAAAGCYRDAVGPDAGVPVVVRLADGSAPTGTVDRVEVYVTEIAASTTGDTLPDEQEWQVIAVPRRRFDLAAIRAGSALLAAEGALPSGVYRAVRLTIDVDSSRVRFVGGDEAYVRWPVASGRYAVHAIVEQPLDASAERGLDLVLDVQLVQSLTTNLDPQFDFAFFPVVRAVDSHATGGVAGVVSADDDGDGVGAPLADAAVTVYQGDAAAPLTSWRIVTVARSDPRGGYRIGFLLAGTYIVRVEAAVPLPPVEFPDLLIVAGGESRLDVTLTAPTPEAGDVDPWSVQRDGRRT